MDSDIQEFLCKMLGDGFQLEKSVIQDVVGQCGYNMPMSIDKLIDLSGATLEKSDDVVGVSAGKAAKNSLDLESVSCRTKSPVISVSGRSNSDGNRANGVMLPETKKDVQREILEALFSAPDRFEERKPIVPTRKCHRSAHGHVVTKPPNETLIEDFVYINGQPINGRSDESKETSYEELRRAVAEYWVIMKEYLKASLEAYSTKDYETAEKLQEENELSAQKLIEGSDEHEDYSINVHFLEPKDALQHMKLSLSSLSGLASIPYLKAVVGTNGADKKDARRKRLITKLLEKEGIPWMEGDGWIISVRVDEIDPSNLSFVNK
ncbi:hypothetical protein CASFOL_036667 [Castilleja foliolosa]|uniref:Nuclear RNA export factor SDE5 n=1 Tax=Castilleja foliolosa TaxID=1961234 RepID=A0ABD3BQV4_9LAMI